MFGFSNNYAGSTFTKPRTNKLPQWRQQLTFIRIVLDQMSLTRLRQPLSYVALNVGA